MTDNATVGAPHEVLICVTIAIPDLNLRTIGDLATTNIQAFRVVSLKPELHNLWQKPFLIKTGHFGRHSVVDAKAALCKGQQGEDARNHWKIGFPVV